MTPKQYYFPYFFNQNELNKSLKEFGLSTKVVIDRKTKMANRLIITETTKFNLFKKENELLEIPFWTTLMIVNSELIYWKTEEDIIDIVKVDLKELRNAVETQNSVINISTMKIGNNVYQSYLGLNNFVTFVRKSNLKYDQEYFENFVIIIINQQDIKLIPYEEFNKKGGDYGYVWPAILRMDIENKKLYGKGMRMTDFEINI